MTDTINGKMIGTMTNSITNSIKVLHLGNELSWRGGENQIRLLIEGIEELQNAGADEQNNVGQYGEQKIENDSRHHNGQKSERNLRIENFVAYPKNSQSILEKRFSVTQLALPSRWPFDPRNIYALFKFCRLHQIDILDCHSSKAHSLGLYLKNFLPEIKLVVHRHVDNLPTNSFLKRSKYTSEKVDGYVAISTAIAKILEQNGVAKDKIAVVKSTVPDQGFTTKEKIASKLKLASEFNVIADQAFIGNASALSWQKGYEVLIEACAILKSRNIRFVCFCAGAGKEEEKYKALVAKLNIKDHVYFVGFRREVRPFLLALDILAAPSRNEGLGTIFLEAAYSGAALVGTNVGGIPEIIQNGVTGQLVEREDAQGLSFALENLIQDEALREKLVSNCLDMIKQKFSVRQMVKGNLLVYRKVMAEY